MHLTAVVAQSELAALVDSLTPMRVTIDERRGRSVTLGRPRTTLVAGKGLRLRGDARVAWDVAGVAIPVTLQAWQLLLVPRIVSRGRSRVLAFEPVVEELDLKLVPAFLDDKIASAITGAIAQYRDRIAWDFARTLSRRFALWKRISPAKTFEIVATDGAVEVGQNELRLTVRFQARIEDRAAAAEGKAAGKKKESHHARPQAAAAAPSAAAESSPARGEATPRSGPSAPASVR
jgi:hypothetical protein